MKGASSCAAPSPPLRFAPLVRPKAGPSPRRRGEAKGSCGTHNPGAFGLYGRFVPTARTGFSMALDIAARTSHAGPHAGIEKAAEIAVAAGAAPSLVGLTREELKAKLAAIG